MRGPLITRRRAKRLRRPLTRAELALWSQLKRERLSGVHWRVQHPIGPFILDFYCSAANLAVELDGASHIDHGDYDARRDAWVAERGIRTLRLPNAWIQGDLTPVMQTIRAAAQEQMMARVGGAPGPLRRSAPPPPHSPVQGRLR